MADPRKLELALRLKAAVEGLGELKNLAQEITDLGGDATEVADKAGKLADELAELARQQTVIEVFRQVSEQADAAARQIEELRQQSAAAAAEQSTFESNLNVSRQALEAQRVATAELGAQVSRASIEVKEASSLLKEQQAAAKAAGAGNDELKLAVLAAREALDLKKRALSEQNAALKSATQTERELEAAVREDQAAIEQKAAAIAKLRPQIEATEASQRELTVELERGRNALKFAGVDASNLAAEEQRVTRETIETKNAVSQLTLELRDQRNELRGVADATQTAAASTERLRREQDEARARSTGFTGAIAGQAKNLLALGAAYFGLNEAKNVLVDLLKTGDQFEVFEKQLAATFGTTERGEAAFAWIRDFAKRTPLELGEVLEATVQLKNFGLDPLDGTLQALVDQNAKLGGSQERLQRIITATGQAFAKGRLQGEELLQFAEAGVPVFDLLAKTTGRTTSEVIKLAEQGRLGRDVIRELIAAIGQNAAGSAAAQMETLSGRVSNAKDNYQQFLDVVANNGPLELAKEEISGIGAALGDSDTAARVVGQSIVSVVQALFALGNVGAAFAKSFKLAFDTVGSAVSSVLAGIALGISKLTFGDVSKQFEEVADVLFTRSREFAESAAQDAESIRQSYSDAYIRIGNSIGAGVEAVKAANGEITESARAAARETIAVADAAKIAADAREQSAKQEAEALQAVRAEAQATGLDYSRLTTQIGEETAKRISALRSLADNASASGAVVRAAFDQALSAAETVEEARAIGEAIKGVEKPGLDVAKALDLVAEKVRVLPTEAERANTALNEAFKTLGIVAKSELERAATAAELAYMRIRESGTATTEQLAQGFAAVAQKRLELAAVEGEADLRTEASRLRAVASTQAQRDALDEVIATFPLLQQAAVPVLDGLAESGNKAADALSDIKSAIAGAEDVQQLEDLRSALLRAYNDGTIAAQEYEAAVVAITEKQLELERAANGARSGASKALADLVTGNQRAFRELSDEAGATFDRLVENSGRAGITSVMQFIENFNKGLSGLNRIRDEQSAATERLIEQLGDQGTATVAVINQALGAADAFKFVDSQRLDNLNAAIDGARSRLRGLRDDAASTVSSLRDELDRLQGNTEAIEQRRRDAQRAELEAKIAQARTFGDRETERALLQGLSLLDEIERTRAQQIRDEGGTPAPTTRTTTEQTRVTRRVEVQFSYAGSNDQPVLGLFEETDADRLLEQFARDRLVAGR